MITKKPLSARRIATLLAKHAAALKADDDSTFRVPDYGLLGANLSNANLGGADLRRARLSGTNFSGAFLRGARLANADLTNANLSDADLDHADLTNANLFQANLKGARLANASLKNATMNYATLDKAFLFSADLSSATLTSAHAQEADFASALMISTNLLWADLRGAILNRAILLHADLQFATLGGADLTNANLSDAALKDIDLSDLTRLHGTCLSPYLLRLQRIFCRRCPPVGRHGGRIVYRTNKSEHVGHNYYQPGHTYVAPIFSFDSTTDCHPGIYASDYQTIRSMYPGAPIVRAYVRDGEWVITGKGAIRCKRIRILDEVGPNFVEWTR